MTSASNPAVYTIPPHRAFADALAAGLLAQYSDVTQLARGVVLLPNNRTVRTVTDAFVRRAEGGLLLPRLIAIGDDELDLRLGGLFDPLSAEPIPPSVAPMDRLMLLSRLVRRHMPDRIDAAEAVRLARELARTLDQLLVEQIDPQRLRTIAADQPDLSEHWQKSLDRLTVILDEWPRLLSARGQIDLADRRNRLLNATTRRWREDPPPGFVIAAGINTTAPAVAGLLRVIARMLRGQVVLSALDTHMPEDQWQALGPHEPDPVTGRAPRAIETHPQFHLKLLLERMGIARSEVRLWRWGTGDDAPPARTRAISNAMAPAAATAGWQSLAATERQFGGVVSLELADPAEEAQAVAIAMREALEEPGRTAALVTPDRLLARRVSAHLKRWGIEADDSAGRPLSETPPGTLILAVATAAAESFAPVPLLSLLKHPLVKRGEDRLDWLDGARALDLALRGPRPPGGLEGIGEHLLSLGPKSNDAAIWWAEVKPLLEPLQDAFGSATASLAGILDALRQTLDTLAGEDLWSGPAGRCASDFIQSLQSAETASGVEVETAGAPALLQQLMADYSVRPPYGQHPRVSIWGLLEARLQHADLMILGGLNEGVWPSLPSPDPWLAPRIRHDFGLPALERRIGLSAHDFATALGGKQVLLTRARRDARSPTVASRFWLRLEAMSGGMARASEIAEWVRGLDRPVSITPADRPAPVPIASSRPRRISVTELDRLKADPYAFYARKMLHLTRLDPVDADPSAAWRGTAVHSILEAWATQDNCDPDALRQRAETLLRESAAHPLMRALWQPRLMEAIDWIASEVQTKREEGRVPVAAEVRGKCCIGDVELYGIADRIDRNADGSLAIVDYKTGKAPSARAVHEGYAMQLGLLGLIAERKGFGAAAGRALAFEYWSLAKERGRLGHISSPVGGRTGVDPEEFTSMAERNFISAANTWLLGDAPFTAKLNPRYSPYTEYDQLMRLDEWYGRTDDRQ